MSGGWVNKIYGGPRFEFANCLCSTIGVSFFDRIIFGLYVCYFLFTTDHGVGAASSQAAYPVMADEQI